MTRFRIQSLLILTAIAACYASVIAWVDSRALWGRVGLDPLGNARVVGVLRGLSPRWRPSKHAAPGPASCASPRRGLRWAHALPGGVALIMTALFTAIGGGFPVFFASFLLLCHAVLESATETAIATGGVVRVYFFPVRRQPVLRPA